MNNLTVIDSNKNIVFSIVIALIYVESFKVNLQNFLLSKYQNLKDVIKLTNASLIIDNNLSCKY